MTMYYDTESNEFITEKQLRNEYSRMINDEQIDSDITFEWYVHNSLTCFGGTLKTVCKDGKIR